MRVATTAGRPHELLPDMVRLPAGEFFMGSDEESDERPVHRVYLDEYSIAVHPVTNEDYARFVRTAGHRAPAVHDLPLIVTAGGEEREHLFRQYAARHDWVDGLPPPDMAQHPVTLVTWADASAYCRWLAHESGTPVRLPTEAEWEKAARGGLDGRRFPWGDEIDPSYANYLPDPSLKAVRGTTAVGSYPPNAFGLYDMAGNVWQWVSDWYRSDYYATAPFRNPTGPPQGKFRVVRGGAWVDVSSAMLRCAYRHHVPLDTYSYSIGFRIACSSKTPRARRAAPDARLSKSGESP